MRQRWQQRRPDRGLGDGCGTVLHLSAPRPFHGWQWRDPTPGFRFGEQHDEWRVTSRVEPKDIPARAGVLIALTDRPKQTEAFWHDGRCIGVTFEDGARQRLCNPTTPFVFLAHAEPHAGSCRGMFVIGIARSGVTRITADGSQVFDGKTPPWWGGWEDSTIRRQVTPKASDRRGLPATAHVAFDAPGEKLYCASALRGVCGISAHRRS